MIGMTSAPDTTPTIMDVKQLLLVQINEALEPPAPRPIFTAEIEYPPECWYRLKDEAERTPEELAEFMAQNLSPQTQVTFVTGLDKARMETKSTCGLTLVVLFTRDFEGNLILDDIRFMDAVELSAFKMNNGKPKERHT